MTTLSVLSVAKEILSQASEKGDKLKPLKLMKLTYMAHAVKLAMLNEPMFEEDVQAWKYGPVISELYQKIKTFGNSYISLDAFDEDCLRGVSGLDKKIIEIVIMKWGDKTGPQLSSATHQQGTPWYKVWHEGGGMFSANAVIPNSSIAKHYRSLLFVNQ